MKIIWHRTNEKSVRIGNNHAVLTKCAVNDEQVSVLVSAAYDSHMLVTGIEYQVTRLGLIPRDGSAIGVLGVGTASVAYDIFSIGDIVKYPIHKSTAIEPVGKVGPGG